MAPEIQWLNRAVSQPANIVNESCLPLLDLLRELREAVRAPLTDASVAPLYIRARPNPSSSVVRHAVASRLPVFGSSAPVTSQIAVAVWNAVLPWERAQGLSGVPAEVLQSAEGRGFPYPRIWEDMKDRAWDEGGDGHGIVSPARGMIFVNTPMARSNKSTFWCGDIHTGLDVAFVECTSSARQHSKANMYGVWRRSLACVGPDGPRDGGDAYLGGAEMAAQVMGHIESIHPLHPKKSPIAATSIPADASGESQATTSF